MTSPELPSCVECGRVQWSGDRFCAACGTEYAHHSLTTYHDLDESESVTSTDAPARSSRREALLGLATLAVIIVAVAGLFVLGGRSSDEVTAAPDETTPSASEAEDRLSPSPEPTRPIPQPEPYEGLQPFEQITPRPGSVAYPRPTPSEYEELIETVVSLDMGSGWMVVSEDRQTVAVNLETGELVTAAGQFSQDYGQRAFALPQGILASSYGPSSDQTWRLNPWSVDETSEYDVLEETSGENLDMFVDDVVGPVVVTFSFGADLSVNATALSLGEERSVSLADPVALLARGFQSFAGPLALPNAGLWVDDGSTVYRWTWTDGWLGVTAGQVAFVDAYGVGVLRCSGPTDCPGVIIDRDGVEYATFESGAVGSPFSQNILSPQLVRTATNTFDGNPSTITDLLTGTTTRLGGQNAFGWSAHAWSPNGRYIVVSRNGTLSAFDVESEEVHTLGQNNSFAGEFGLVFLDEIDR